MPKNPLLLVEDEADLVEALSERLEMAGYDVLHCDRVSTALTMLRNQKFSCILLDLHLEQGSGEQVVDAVRSDKRQPNFKTPILVISGHIDREIVRSLGKQINGALVKPFGKEELLQKIQSLVKA